MNQEKKQRNPLLTPVILLTALVVVLMIMLLLSEIGHAQRPSENAISSTAEFEAGETTLSVATKPEETTPPLSIRYYEATGPAVETEPPVAYIQINTPYATLSYPEQWEDYLRVEQIHMDMGMIVMFMGRVGNVEVELFNISFGGTGGIPVGIYTPDNGVPMDVTAEMWMFSQDAGWSDEDYARLVAMQEAMNDVIEKLCMDDSITPVA